MHRRKVTSPFKVQITKIKHSRGSDAIYSTSPIYPNEAFSKPQQKLLLTLFPTILLVCGKVNFTNLSRYNPYLEKAYRRYYSQGFKFIALNIKLIEHGNAGRSKHGLEISLIVVVDVETGRSYSLSVQQTSAQPKPCQAKAPGLRQGMTGAMIEAARQMLDQLPDKPKSGLLLEAVESEPTRIDAYLDYL